MTADQLNKEQWAVIVDCNNQQMQELGFIPGEKMKVIAMALFGGSCVVRIGVSTFAVRNEELKTVEVQLV